MHLECTTHHALVALQVVLLVMQLAWHQSQALVASCCWLSPTATNILFHIINIYHVTDIKIITSLQKL